MLEQIERCMRDACRWNDDLQQAIKTGDAAAIQHAAAGLHTSTQTVQVLAHLIEKRITEHRRKSAVV